MNDQRFLVIGGSGFIGTHLVEALIRRQANLRSIDITPPTVHHHRDFWVEGDIMTVDHLQAIVSHFEPTHVLHLAAKANLTGRRITDFPENTIGTENVIRCVNTCGSIERFIFFSTQYVVTPGVWPETDTHYLPYTAYGASKAEAEKIVRTRCKKNWTILRPTNVWGPFHAFFPHELWKFLRLRCYIHPGRQPIIKHYAYVANAVDQALAITLAPARSACGRVFYITDPPIDNADWMNAFSIGLSGKPVRWLPRRVWRQLAFWGDWLNRLGIKSPMTSERYFRLTVNERLPYQPTMELAGAPRISLQEGATLSIAWYRHFLAGDALCHSVG